MTERERFDELEEIKGEVINIFSPIIDKVDMTSLSAVYDANDNIRVYITLVTDSRIFFDSVYNGVEIMATEQDGDEALIIIRFAHGTDYMPVLESYFGYTYSAKLDEDGNEYIGLCKEFPSMSWVVGTKAKALEGIHCVVTEILSDMEICEHCGEEPAVDGDTWCEKCLQAINTDIDNLLADWKADYLR